MRTRIRLVLPLVQMAIAIALTASNRLRPQSWESPTSLAYDWQLCCGLNAPATLIWSCLMRFHGEWYWEYPLVGVVLETLVYFALVGLLWYIVSVEMGGKGQSSLTPRTRMRGAADALAMIFGRAVATFGLLIRLHGLGYVTTYSTLVAARRAPRNPPDSTEALA
jgi:hypothetical protein